MVSIREIGENIKNSQFFKGDVVFDECMSGRTTMKVGGNADVFVVPQDVASAVFTAWFCARNNTPVFVLGGGSNIVVSDDGLHAVVLSLEKISSIICSSCGDDSAVLYCGAGAKIDEVAEFCASHCLEGLEYFSGLPGSAGGASYMNARCYEKSISDVLVQCEYVDLNSLRDFEKFDVSGLVKTYTMHEDDWSYKHSPFMNMRALVLSVGFKVTVLSYSDENRKAIHEKNEFYVNDRKDKGHFKAPSAGSVFKNNRSYGKPSGRLIDEAGLKGFSVGGAQIAPWHGNFIINNGNATAADIKKIVEVAQESVKSKTGCLLEPEIIFI